MNLYIIVSITILATLLIVGVWAFKEYRKLYGHYFNFWIVLFIFFFLVPAYAQEEVLEDPPIVVIDDDPAIIPLPDKPMVFPDEMPKAAQVIADFVIGNESDHNMFLSDTYWPVPIGNNTTTLNMTA